MDELSAGPFKAYDLMTSDYLGGYESRDMAYIKNADKAITVIYRPGRKKVKK